jgi:hypothetical protein
MQKKQISSSLKNTTAQSARTTATEKSAPAITIPLHIPVKKVLRSRLAKFVVILIVIAAACLFSYHLGRSSDGGDAVPSAGSLQTTDAVVQRVSRHILLPSGEQPTVATVSDANKVRNQAFFAHAATGDKVLIYANAKKAYLYRPSIDRIIEVAPLAPNQQGQSGS